MTIFQPCPYNKCQYRLQVKVSDTIDQDLQTTKEKAMGELKHRLDTMLKKGHKNGEHKRGR